MCWPPAPPACGRCLLGRHILPACLPSLLAQATLGVGIAILEAAGLSFLGLGAQPPAPEWGAMIAQGRGAVFAAPHVMLFPGLALVVTVLGFNLVGDSLQDLLDARRRGYGFIVKSARRLAPSVLT